MGDEAAVSDVGRERSGKGVPGGIAHEQRLDAVSGDAAGKRNSRCKGWEGHGDVQWGRNAAFWEGGSRRGGGGPGSSLQGFVVCGKEVGFYSKCDRKPLEKDLVKFTFRKESFWLLPGELCIRDLG